MLKLIDTVNDTEESKINMKLTKQVYIIISDYVKWFIIIWIFIKI